MITKIDGRKVVTCRQAAQILEVSMGRVRQLARAGQLWHDVIGERTTLFDEAEVRKLAKVRQMARDAGIMRGKRPGGFKPDVYNPKRAG